MNTFSSSFKNSFSEKILRKNLISEAKESFDNDNFEGLLEKLDQYSNNNIKISKNNLNTKSSTYLSNLLKSISFKISHTLYHEVFYKIHI